MTESSKGVSVLYGPLRLSLTDPPPPSPFSLPTKKKRTLKVLCRSCSLVFQMVNHRSQIHLAQTGDDDRSQTWVWDENSLIWIRIKWDWKHHFFWHWTCSSASSLWNARWQLALFLFFLISYPKLSQKTLFSFDSVAEGWVLPWVVFDRLTGKLSLGDRCKRRWSCCWPSLDLTPGSRNAQSGFPLIPTNQGCKCVLLAIQNGLPPFGKLNAPIGHEAFLVILDCVSGLWSTSLAETKSVREEARGRSLRLIRIELHDSPREGVLLQLQFTMALRWRSDTFPDMASRTISLFCVWMPIGEFEWNILLGRWFPFSFVLLVSNMAVSLQWNWRVRESQFAYGALHSESMDCFWEPSSDPIQKMKEGIWRHNKRLMPWKSAKDSKRGWFGFLCKKKMLSKLTSYTEHRNKLRLSQGPTLFHQENSSIPQSPYTGWKT